MDEQQLRDWAAQVAGRPVREVSRVGYGASRATFVLELGGDDLVARVDTGDGPMAGTELSLAREAEVYRALAGSGVRIPRLHAVAAGGDALLVERAAGTHETAGLTDDDRHAVYDDYLDALADLHRVDAGVLDLPSFRRPTDGPSHAGGELDLWGRILRERTTGPWPLAHVTEAVLRRCAPASVSRTVLCHGDVGPGNFMHDGRRVTALLDWEFSHLGDPMDDLAWWVFRGHDMAGGCGDLAAQLRRWSAATGLPVDVRAVEYYRAFVMWRWLVSVASTIDNGGSGMDRSVHFALVPVLAARLPPALAGLMGVELAPPPELPQVPPGPAEAVLDALSGDLREVIAPAVQTAEARRRVNASLLYLWHLQAANRIGAAVTRSTIDDTAALTGQRTGSVAEAHAAVAALVAGGDPPWDEVLRWCWRDGHRQVALWPPVAPRAFAPVTVIPDPTGA